MPKRKRIHCEPYDGEGAAPASATKAAPEELYLCSMADLKSDTKEGTARHVRIDISTKSSTIHLWELPEIIHYEIAQFCVPPMQRASFLCHKLAVLSKDFHKAILAEGIRRSSVILWDSVLKGDYGVTNATNNSQGRRSCKRLRRSPIDQVRDAHKLMIDNTEIAYYYLWEMSSSKAKNNCLTRRNLVSILETYGPKLMYNKIMSSGGTFLVEVCRCRNANSSTLLQCVKELVEERGALVNKATNESSNSVLTALCVAAVRGMPKLVEYLLSKSASTEIKCSGRFRLHTNSKKSIRCNNATPLEFSKTMFEAEKDEGANTSDLGDLLACIKLLGSHNFMDIAAGEAHDAAKKPVWRLNYLDVEVSQGCNGWINHVGPEEFRQVQELMIPNLHLASSMASSTASVSRKLIL